MNVHFRFRFVFGRKWNSFSSAFSFTAEKKMLFGRPLVQSTSQKGLGLQMQSLGLGLEHYRLGLGLEGILKSWSWS